MGFETSAAWPYPNLGANITNQPWSGGSNFVNPGQMWMHPNNGTGDAATRFTVPNDGTYDVSAVFSSNDYGHGGTDVHVLVNGTSLEDADVDVDSVSFDSGGLSLPAGDTIDFVVGDGADGNFYNDMTGLNLAITQIDGSGGGSGSTPTIGGYTSSNAAFNVQMEPIFASPGQQFTAPIAQFFPNDSSINMADVTAVVDTDSGSFNEPIVPLADGQYGVDLTCTPSAGLTYAGDSVDYALYLIVDGNIAYQSPSLPLYVTDSGTPGTLSGISADVTTSGTTSMTLGGFTDPNNSTGDPSVYGAQIDWNDGNVTWDGSVTPDGNGGFVVSDSHAYAQDGTYNPAITVYGDGGAWVGTTTITVATPVIPVTLSTSNISASDTSPVSGVIASFTSSDPNATAADFSATINWADGSAPEAVTPVYDSSSGQFDIAVNHAFSAGGVFNGDIEIDSPGGESADAAFTSTVSDPALSFSTTAVAAVGGEENTLTIATLYDSNWSPDWTAASVSATVDWQDGNGPVAATVVPQSDGGWYNVVATYAPAATGNLAPVVMFSDVDGDAYIAAPPLCVNIQDPTDASQGQAYTIGLSATGANAGLVANWLVNWGDGSAWMEYPGTDTSETHTFGDSTTSAGISVEALDSSGNVLQSASADEVDVVPDAPSDFIASWNADYSLTFNWTNNSATATGIELDFQSGDGQTNLTVVTLDPDVTTYTIAAADVHYDPGATYYLYATADSGSTYSDSATVQPSVILPTLTQASASFTSDTLAYSNPDNLPLTLYYRSSSDNMEAYSTIGSGNGTVTVDGLAQNSDYFFQLDGYVGDREIQSSLVERWSAAAPTITSVVEDFTGIEASEYNVTFKSTDPNILGGGSAGFLAQLAVWQDGDTYHLYPAAWVSTGTTESPISYTTSSSGGNYTVTATYYILTEGSQAAIQLITPDAPPSAAYEAPNSPIPTNEEPTPVTITSVSSDPNQANTLDIHFATGNSNNQWLYFYEVTDGQVAPISLFDEFPGNHPYDGQEFLGDGMVTASEDSVPADAQIFEVSLKDFDPVNYTVWGHSDYSNFVETGGAEGNDGFIAAPSDLAVAPDARQTAVAGQNIYDVTWTDNSSNETGFVVAVSPPNANDWHVADNVTTADTTQGTITQADLNNDVQQNATTYDVAVAAVDGNGNMSDYDIIHIAPPPAKAADFFFDGTNNDGERDAPNGEDTNVYKMYLADDPSTAFTNYEYGIGTITNNLFTGAAFGAGASAIEARAWWELIQDLNQGSKNIDIIGFSRGGPEALDFSNRVANGLTTIPKLNPYDTPVHGVGGATVYLDTSGVKIRFLGLYDPVDAFWGGRDNTGGLNVNVPACVEDVSDAVALSEHREHFDWIDLTHLTNVTIVGFMGAHADIGGGYADHQGIANTTLHWMMDQAVASGMTFTNTYPDLVDNYQVSQIHDSWLIFKQTHTIGEAIVTRHLPDDLPCYEPQPDGSYPTNLINYGDESFTYWDPFYTGDMGQFLND